MTNSKTNQAIHFKKSEFEWNELKRTNQKKDFCFSLFSIQLLTEECIQVVFIDQK